MKTESSADALVLPQARVDWKDITFALFLGIVFALMRLADDALPSWKIGGAIDNLLAAITIIYIFYQARREPEKLQAWGLNTPLSLSALVSAFVLGAIGIAALAAGSLRLSGNLVFEPYYIAQMIEYIPAAFPQQFAMCSLGLATLATLKPFRGLWRLPLVVGLVFSLAHFWTPARISGTIIPLQMVLTFPAGFICTFYFLKYRNILPLTALHAIIYPLLHNWIELQM